LNKKILVKNLTIAIPTYNRPESLERLLNSISKNDLSNVVEIIVVDNCSSYDIDNLINSFDLKIRLIRNNFNIGQAVNMLIPFLHCNSKWLWIIGDDDEVLNSSISDVNDEIQNVSENTIMIKFGKKDDNLNYKNYTARSLEDYIDYYHNENTIRRGDLVFISTNVYNTEILSKYLINAFEYSYTYIGYLIPVFFALNTNQYHVYFSSKKTVKYNVPSKWGWSFTKVGLGLSSLSHLPLKLNNESRKKFLNITMLIDLKLVILAYLNDNESFRKISIKDFKIIYNNIYSHYLPIKNKLIYYIFILLMSNKYTSKILISFLKLLLNK
tara:strand:- start:2752 stop:3729 length:978 start_codon:yes stop_codon:yes gene_type:complete